MKLIRLRLDNFRQHRDTEVEFRDGMTAIVGANGAGKSTLLEAITYALYGQQRKTKETIKFYWSESRTKFKVTLDFEFDGRKFRVERANNEAVLSDITEGIGVRATGLREVTTACEKLLCLNYEQFTNSFCAEQKELAFLNFKSNAARQDEVARMLGFDRLKAAATLAKERNRELRMRIDVLERSMGSLEEIQQRKKDAESKLAGIESEIKAAQKRRKALDSELEPAQFAKQKAERWTQIKAEMDVLAERSGLLKENVKAADSALEQARVEASELTSLAPIAAECAALESELRTLEADQEADRKREAIATEAARLTKEIERIEHDLAALHLPDGEALRIKLAELAEELRAAEAAVKETEKQWQEQHTAAQAAAAAARAKAEQAKADLARSEDMAAKRVCPECGQPTTAQSYGAILDARRSEATLRESELQSAVEAAARASERPKALGEAEARAKDAKERREAAQAALSHASSLEAEAKVLRTQRESCAKQLAAATQALESTPQRHDPKRHADVRARIEQLQPARLRFLKLDGADARLATIEAKAEEAKASYEVAKSKYRELQTQQANLSIKDAREAQSAIAHHQALLEQRAAIDSELRQSEQVRAFAQTAVEQALDALEQYKARGEELKESRSQLLLHEVVARELLDLREALNRSIRPDLESRASENLSLLTNGRYPIIELSDTFEATLVEDDMPKHVISGGEEDVVALSLRLALSELIQERQGRPMSLLILDEVFGSLDADRRQNVLDRLASIKGRFSQILVISHIEEINQVADQCVYLKRDSDSRSTVVADGPPLDQDLLVGVQ